MAARNAGAYIDSALASARAQTMQDIEILVLDDGSTDDTKDRSLRHSAEDKRVRVIDGPACGLSDNRNLSLDMANGQFALILDSDDVLAPDHVEQLLKLALQETAQITSSNLTSFAELGATIEQDLFLKSPEWTSSREISLRDLVQHNCMYSPTPNIGYLKPLFDLSFLRQHAIRYKPTLRIGEDYDIVENCLARGAKYVFSPTAGYFYRRHAGSTSHRITEDELLGLINEAYHCGPDAPDELKLAINKRLTSLENALVHLRSLNALKARDLAGFLRHASKNGQIPGLIFQSVKEGLQKRLFKPRKLASQPANFTILSLDPDETSDFSSDLKTAMSSSHDVSWTAMTVGQLNEVMTAGTVPLFDIIAVKSRESMAALPPLLRFSSKIIWPAPPDRTVFNLYHQGFETSLSRSDLPSLWHMLNGGAT